MAKKWLTLFDEAKRASSTGLIEAFIAAADEGETVDSTVSTLIKSGRIGRNSEKVYRSWVKLTQENIAHARAVIKHGAPSHAAALKAVRLLRDGKARSASAAIKAATKAAKRAKRPLDAKAISERLTRLWNEACQSIGEEEAEKAFAAWWGAE